MSPIVTGRTIVALELDGSWVVFAGYSHTLEHTEQLRGPSSTGVTWQPGSPKKFRTVADVDWSTVPDPEQAQLIPKLREIEIGEHP